MTCGAAAAQPVEVTLEAGRELHRFESAASVAIDPTGHVYVLDAGRGTIVKLDTAGLVLAEWGGSGSGAYAFDQPADLDPTNGLTLYVADAGNRSIKRYSREFLHLETLPVDLTPETTGLGGTSGAETKLYETGEEGRPVAVRAALDGSLYAIEEERGVVLNWNSSRRLERVFGAYDAGEGALVRPVALALGRNGEVYVADPGRRAVVVFDRYGTYLRSLAEGRARDVRAVTAQGERVLVVLPDRLLVYSTRGGLEGVYRVSLDEPLEGAAVAKRTLYLLTPTRLIRFDV